MAKFVPLGLMFARKYGFAQKVRFFGELPASVRSTIVESSSGQVRFLWEVPDLPLGLESGP